MTAIVFNTADQPLPRRGDFWLDTVCRPHLGVLGRTHVEDYPGFYGRMRQQRGDGFQICDVACTAGIAARARSDIATRPLNATAIVIQRAVSSDWRQRDETRAFRRGDVLITDADEPYLLNMHADFDLLTVYVQPEMLRAAGFTQTRTAHLLSGAQAGTTLAAGFADALSRQIDALSGSEATGMVEALCRILAVAAGTAAGEHAATLRAARLQQAQRYVARHLTDPGLSPARCAQDLGISVRSLHLAFEPSGETFAAYVQRLRLEHCHAALTAPGTRRPVADIAFGYGFSSLASFYRAFSAAYGAPPRDIRAAALA